MILKENHLSADDMITIKSFIEFNAIINCIKFQMHSAEPKNNVNAHICILCLTTK